MSDLGVGRSIHIWWYLIRVGRKVKNDPKTSDIMCECSLSYFYSGPPRLARPPRPGPCLDFGFQYALINWTLPGSNSPWRGVPAISAIHNTLEFRIKKMNILFFFWSISLLHLCHLINNKIPTTFGSPTFPCFHLTNFKKVPSYTPVVFETLEYSHLCGHRVVIKHLNFMKQNYVFKTSFLRLLLI